MPISRDRSSKALSNSCLFTFVNVDGDLAPHPVPPVFPTTYDEDARYLAAMQYAGAGDLDGDGGAATPPANGFICSGKASLMIKATGFFPLMHTGRPWLAYWLLPYPNTMTLWPNFRSPLIWDVFAVSTYGTVSALFAAIDGKMDSASQAVGSRQLGEASAVSRRKAFVGPVDVGFTRRKGLEHLDEFLGDEVDDVAVALVAALRLPVGAGTGVGVWCREPAVEWCGPGSTWRRVEEA